MTAVWEPARRAAYGIQLYGPTTHHGHTANMDMDMDMACSLV